MQVGSLRSRLVVYLIYEISHVVFDLLLCSFLSFSSLSSVSSITHAFAEFC